MLSRGKQKIYFQQRRRRAAARKTHSSFYLAIAPLNKTQKFSAQAHSAARTRINESPRVRARREQSSAAQAWGTCSAKRREKKARASALALHNLAKTLRKQEEREWKWDGTLYGGREGEKRGFPRVPLLLLRLGRGCATLRTYSAFSLSLTLSLHYVYIYIHAAARTRSLALANSVLSFVTVGLLITIPHSSRRNLPLSLPWRNSPLSTRERARARRSTDPPP